MPLGGLEGGGGGSAIVEVANYSALPAANTVPGELYAVLASQGTAWLPGSWGGTYYGKGLYYSDGSSWIYTETPYNATQATVDAGTNDDQFVTPKTLKNSTQFQYLDATSSIQTQLDYKVQTILKSVTDYSHTGDTNITKVHSALILANTFSVGDIIDVYAQYRKSGTAGNLSIRVYVNTTDDLTGATQIFQYNSGVAANVYYGIYRKFLIKSSTNTESIVQHSYLNSITNSSTAVSSNNIDWTANQYLLFSLQVTAGADVGTLSGYVLKKE